LLSFSKELSSINKPELYIRIVYHVYPLELSSKLSITNIYQKVY